MDDRRRELDSGDLTEWIARSEKESTTFAATKIDKLELPMIDVKF